jgi:phosphatidylinositol 3-kinase
MDRLLKLENLDLYLTQYRVFTTAQDEGMVEFIPSSSLAQVIWYGRQKEATANV